MTVPNKTIYVRRNGKALWTSNCNRFGYNAHPNLFLNLAKDGFANTLADFMDGKIEGMEKRIRTGVGASVTLFMDHPREGLPVHVDEAMDDHFFPFDGYKEDNQLLLTGYSDEIGIFVDYGATIEQAWDNLWDHLVFDEAVSVPDMYYRTDLAKDDFYNAPLLRMKELKKRGLLD